MLCNVTIPIGLNKSRNCSKKLDTFRGKKISRQITCFKNYTVFISICWFRQIISITLGNILRLFLFYFFKQLNELT